MTTLLAIVRSPDEARSAGHAGADRVALVVPQGWSTETDALLDEGPAAVGLMVTEESAGPHGLPLVRRIIAAGPETIWLPLAPGWRDAAREAVAAGLRTVGCVPPERALTDDVCAEAEALGLAGLLVTEGPFTGRRLLDVRQNAELAGFVASCKARNLSAAFGGALEPPDVPRLMALAPDELGFDLALLAETGRFDAVRVGSLRALIDASSEAAGLPDAGRANDRILVRDWTVTMSIGAYARERDLRQRVRFNIEAEVMPADRRTAGMASVVSYDLITDAIARCAAGHVDLVESLAEDIAAAVLRHPRVRGVEIIVEKLDVGPGTVGCRIVRPRPG